LLVLAGHRAYMAPETVLGAASPVDLSGQDLGETMKRKATNLLAAMARSLTQARGPEAQRAAEAMVTQAQALTAEEALAVGLIDGLAEQPDDLLRALDGQTLVTQHGEVTLALQNAPSITVRPLWIERVLGLLTDPNLVLLLLSVGIQLILIELSSPGGWFAGFLGTLFLGFGVYGLGLLPVNWLGLFFIGLAFLLFVLEAKKSAHGLMALAGAGVFVFGALLLFNTPLALPGQRLSPWWAGALALGMAGLTAVVVSFALKARRLPVLTGAEAQRGLVQAIGWARTDIRPGFRGGTVHVRGELWSARLAPGAAPIRAGQPVRVVAVRGMYLLVEPAESTG